jgi:hypothetical protein
MGTMSPRHFLDPMDLHIPLERRANFQDMQKPLPPPPSPFDRTKSEAPVSSTAASSSEIPSQPVVPSLAEGGSQRPKKRVLWRNKWCMVALPIDSAFGAKTSRDSYLGPEEVARMLREWEGKGYDTNGFLLAPPSLDSPDCFTEGQSRAIHPEPEEESRERNERSFRVSIPDRREWEAYVKQLKEEKLRALGVSFGDEDISRRSSAPSLMSRQASSQSSAMLTSPPLAPQLASAPPLSSGFATALHTPHVGKPGVAHFPRYSMAMPFGERTFSPPNHFPTPSQSPAHGAWLPQQVLGSQSGLGVTLPNVNGNIQRSNGVSSTPPPSFQISTDAESGQDSVEMFNRMCRQQAFIQAQQLHQQHQQQYMLQQRRPPSAGPYAAPETRLLSTTSWSRSDIVSPVPSSHRQNPSETLQKEIDEVESYQDDSKCQVGTGRKSTSLGKERSSERDVIAFTVDEEPPLNGKVDAIDANTVPCVSTRASRPKLNVNAPEFVYEPNKPSESSILFLTGDRLPPEPTENNLAITRTNPSKSTMDGPPHASTLNVAAPEFTPRAIARKPTVPSREFSFSASMPTFRPDAPAFKPSDSETVFSSGESNKENSVEAVKKIFGEIKLTEAIKPTKRSKAIPVLKPDEWFDGLERDNRQSDGQEDESGRITQADGRQKRIRRGLEDGDEVPLFASPKRTPSLSNGDEDRSPYSSSTLSPGTEKAETTTLEATIDLLEEIVDDMSATEASDLMRDDDSLSDNGKPFEPHSSQDIDDAAGLNAARQPAPSRKQASHHLDPTPNDVANATMQFLGKSPQYRPAFEQALDRRSSGYPSSPLDRIQDRNHHEDGIDRVDHARQDIIEGVRYFEPSYDELDIMMKHLNDDSDRGFERQPSPFKRRGRSISPVRSTAREHHHMSRSPVRDLTHELYNTSRTPHLLPSVNMRSDAPSPSPNRLRGTVQYQPQTDSESADASAIEKIEKIARNIANNPLHSPSWPSGNALPVHRLNSPGSTPPSDWNDAISSFDEDKFRSRTGFFDNRVNDVVDTVVQQRLGPLEQVLSGIQQSLATMSSRSASRRPRSSDAVAAVNSDADDEGDTEEPSPSNLKSPPRDRKYDQLKSTVNEILAAQRTFAPATQLVEVMDAVKDLKVMLGSNSPAQSDAAAIKTIVEEVFAKQFRGRSAPVTSSSVAAVAEKSQLQIAGLESMLKIAEGRADDELKARRATEDALADHQRLLHGALQDAAEQRESAEATERSLEEYSEERQEMLQRTAMLESSEQSLQKTILQLSDKNTAMEDTLAEYRLSHEQWRTEIDDARHENKDLRRNIGSFKAEIDESNEDRQALRIRFSRLQEEMSQASLDTLADQLRWKGGEQEHSSKLDILSARLEAEGRARERLELEIERLETQGKEAMKSRSMLEQIQKANVQLQSAVTELQSECHEHQETAARFKGDAHDARESSKLEVQRTRILMGAEIEAAKTQVSIVRADLESVIARLHHQIEGFTTNAEDLRAQHALGLEEMSNSRLREAAVMREAALQDQSRSHEQILREMMAQNERALYNALEDKQRAETYYGNRLSLSDEKVVYYHDKITHLEENLEIAKSAAHAAIQAAQSRKATRSPVSSRKTQQIAKASDIPEKVSPQALRESILVLQEQLQEREVRIEQLEANAAAGDTNAPAKLKDAEIEITWLRELLGVRIDDLEDIISTLSQSSYDREAVKDAAIRLKANLQMEQQEKERALAGGQSFPSLATISSMAASPKALPLAAAAAWGNWRKGRDPAFGSMGALANSTVQQTPSKSSPQGFFAGLMTPPKTSMRTTPPIAGNSKPIGSASKRPVRPPSTPRQDFSFRNDMRLQQDPVTPPLMRKASYDLDADERVSGFGDEGIEGSRMAGEGEEPFGPRLGGIVRAM